MPSPNYPVLCCPLPYRVTPVFVQVVFPPLGWSPLSSFPVIDAYGLQVVTREVHPQWRIQSWSQEGVPSHKFKSLVKVGASKCVIRVDLKKIMAGGEFPGN